MFKKLCLQVVVVLVGALVFNAQAQTTTVGTISGTIRDEKGAVVPKAEVSIQGEGTGIARTVTSDDNGFFLAASLPAGRYTVSTSPSGFKKTVAADVDLHVSENKVLNLDVQVGQVSETVTVSSDAAPVETRNGELSSLISEKQVTELPLNGRNYAQEARLAPPVPGLTLMWICRSTATSQTPTCGRLTVSITWTWVRTRPCWSFPQLTPLRSFA
jgi:hypothetical protein